MKKLSSIAALGCFLLAPAFAGAADHTQEASVSFNYGMADSVFDSEGTKDDLPDGVDASFMIIGLDYSYKVMDGLKVGVSLPIVQKANKVDIEGLPSSDESTFGLGDPTIGATYMHSINDTLAVGGGMDFKLSMGESENQAVLTTDEAMHITAKGLVSATPVENLGIDLDAGYIITIGGPSADGVDLDHGDTLFTNLYIGYNISGITPRIGVHYSTTSAITYAKVPAGAPISEGDEVEDSERNRLSISAAVDYDLSDSMTITAGVGANSIHEGTNLPYGYALSGANYAAGLAFGLGFSAGF